MYPKIILFILLPLFAFSQSPQKINFQSILRNTNGEVQSNKSVSLKISILSGSISGSSVYSETHTKTTDISGLISLQIGNGTVLSGVFGNIAWGNLAHFIKLEVDFSGGSNYVLLGTQELMSVPYALYASKTDTSVLNLASRFNSKVNTSDTASMLINYRNELNNKLNTSDTFFMLSNYWTGLNNKVSFSDTSNMLNPYMRKADAISSAETDPVFNTSIAKGITGIDTAYWNRKLNVADTTSMLTNYRTGLNNKVNNTDFQTGINAKVNIADTASMLTNYRTGLNDKVGISDTANMLANYRTGLNDKVGISDTANMLANYLKKADVIIAQLESQINELQSLKKITDMDGNTYYAVKIGNQIWMTENFKGTHFRNGDNIPFVPLNNDWEQLTTPAYCVSPDGEVLYNWYAVMDNRNIAPLGWRIANEADWSYLNNLLGLLATIKLRTRTGWIYSQFNPLENITQTFDNGGTNEYGFNLKPNSWRHIDGNFSVGDKQALFWTPAGIDSSYPNDVCCGKYAFSPLWSWCCGNDRLSVDASNPRHIFFGYVWKRDGFPLRMIKE